MKHILTDIGIESDIKIMTDSSSAKGIVNRQGCGKVKHLEARQLWLQEKVLKKTMKMEKVPRADNPSDALTHAWTGPEGDIHFPAVGLRLYSGITGENHLLIPRGGVENTAL